MKGVLLKKSMNKYLIVNTEVLPEYFEKIIEARKLIDEHRVSGISEACQLVGISRSTYYKYKDHVFMVRNNNIERKAELHCLLNHKQGVLSEVLQVLSSQHCNLLTIYQSLPLNDVASCSMQVDISNMDSTIDAVIEQLNNVEDVVKVKLIALE